MCSRSNIEPHIEVKTVDDFFIGFIWPCCLISMYDSSVIQFIVSF